MVEIYLIAGKTIGLFFLTNRSFDSLSYITNQSNAVYVDIQIHILIYTKYNVCPKHVI